MAVAPEDVTKGIDLLVDATDQLERRLVEAGYDKEEFHDWMSHLRSVLGYWKYPLEDIAAVCNADDLTQVPKLLEIVQRSILLRTNVYNEWHMTELEKMLEKVLISDGEEIEPTLSLSSESVRNRAQQTDLNLPITKVGFRIFSTDLNPVEVSERLNLRPDYSHVRGEVPVSKSPLSPYSSGIWIIDSTLEPTAKLEAHLLNILERLDHCKDELKDIAKSATLDFYCILHEEAFQLSPYVLDEIASIDADLGVVALY